MKDFSSTTFKYNGRKYNFAASLLFPKTDEKIPLDNNVIEEFEYESEFNGLSLRGSLTYVDETGKVDKCFDQSNVMCQVQMFRLEQSFDGSITLEQSSEVDKFAHVFIVDSVLVLSRESTRIRYRINLVGSNLYRCMSNVDYSNYGQGKQSCIDIVRNCIVKTGQEVDSYTFDKVKTDVRLDYITNGNDDLFSVVKYVFGRMYYCGNYDESMKFVFYDELRAAYRLFDMKRPEDTTTGNRPVVLSLMKSGSESLITEEPVRMGSVTKMTQTEAVRAFSDCRAQTYDFDRNSFGEKKVTIEMLHRYFNARPDSQKPVTQPREFSSKDLNTGMLVNGSAWNNDFDAYGQVTRCLLKNNALLVETFGELQCIPGCTVAVKVDRDYDYAVTQDPDQLEEQMNRYLAYEGVWYAARVHSKVMPSAQKYRQVLTLVRNFTQPEQKA